MKKAEKYSPEVIERAVRLVAEVKEQHASEWAAIVSIAAINPATFYRTSATHGSLVWRSN